MDGYTFHGNTWEIELLGGIATFLVLSPDRAPSLSFVKRVM